MMWTNNTSAQIKLSIERTLLLPDFPSASALEWYNNRLYVVGDDATHLLVLDGDYQRIDSFTMFAGTDKRIAKKSKPDLEAATIIDVAGTPNLLLVGSASTSENRSVAWLLPLNHEKLSDTKGQAFDTRPFFEQVIKSGIAEINVEGVTSMHHNLLLANRGNKTNPANYLLLTKPDFWNADTNRPHICELQLPVANCGISGLAYVAESDVLIFTASQEDTQDAIQDGAIGDSYLGFVFRINNKKNAHKLQPDNFINLAQNHAAFAGAKIESVCVESSTKNRMVLHLCADNDDGQSTLYKVAVTL